MNLLPFPRAKLLNLPDGQNNSKTAPLLQMWKLGVLAVVAVVITTGLLINGSQDHVISAVGADVVSVSSGDWSSSGTWSTGNAPQPGQAVEVAAGHRVVFDADLTDAGIGKLDIFGTLDFSRDAHTVLESRGNIIVRDGGELLIGTVSNPLHSTVNARIVFDVADNGLFVGGAFFEESDTGLWVFNGGRWESHGAPIETPWTKLAAPAAAGATSVIAEGNLSDWYIGGDVLITATGRNISTSLGTTTYFTEDEERLVTGVTPLGNGTTRVELDAPLAYGHSGSADRNDARGEIALLSRNVQVTSKTDQRAHTVYMWGGLGAPSYTQFQNLGPKNVFSRYPVHFHLLAETSVGRSVRGNVIWDSENRFMVIHNSLGMTLESNIGYRSLKSGFWLEDTFNGAMGPKPLTNSLIRNLAVKVSSVDRADRRVTGIWVERENHYIDNVVVSVTGSSDTSGFHWPEGGVSTSDHVFLGNEAHSSAAFGLFGWQNHGRYHIVDFSSWRNDVGVRWGAYSNDVQFHQNRLFGNDSSNFSARNNRPHIQESHLYGEPDYPTKDGLFIDFYTLPSTESKPGKVIRSNFDGHTGFDITHTPKTSCGSPSSTCIPTFTAIIDSNLSSPGDIGFGSDWQTDNTYFDVKNYNGTVPGLPQNFRITRPDQPKPSANAFYVSQFDAWVDPDNPTPSQWKLPPTIQWDQDYTAIDLAAGPVTLAASAQGFTGTKGEIEFFINEFQDGRPWAAEYYPNVSLAGQPVTVLDQQAVRFKWSDHKIGSGLTLDASALRGILPDGAWSGRFTRSIRSVGGTFEYNYRANDGLRLFIDGQLLASSWKPRSACCSFEGSGQIVLSPGEHEVVLEYQHNSVDAGLLEFDIYRMLPGSTASEAFTFDAADVDRKYMNVYARARDAETGLFAYSPILRFRNPTFFEAVPSAPGAVLPTPVPPPTVAPPATPTPVPVPTATPTPDPLASPTPTPEPGSGRITDGLVALYELEEGTGGSVADTSGFGAPLDLTVQNQSNVTWVPGGIRLNSATSIESSVGADKISTAVKANSEITVEGWVLPANLSQGGPARIVTISNGSLLRNVTLGQVGDSYIVRLKSSNTSTNGVPQLNSSGSAATQSLQHVVYTRDSSGNTTLYIDGIVVKTGVTSGSLNSWDGAFKLALGNEIGAARAWLGDLLLIAIYDRALPQTEVEQNYFVGEDSSGTVPIGPTPTPESTATPVPQPTSTPIVGPPLPVQLLVSDSPDRSTARPLEGATLSGNAFIFTSPDDGRTDHVTFFIDDAGLSGTPFNADGVAKYDLAGTDPGSGLAFPFVTGERLANGSHSLAAEISYLGPAPQVVTANFNVSNAGPTPTATPVPQATATPVPQPVATATSAPVQSGAPPPPPAPTAGPSITTPSAPRNLRVTVGDGEAFLDWSVPASNGGSPIGQYRVLVIPSGRSLISDGFVTEATVTGLENGTAYSFQVSAANAVGFGDSVRSAQVTPEALVVATPVPTATPVSAPTVTPQPLPVSGAPVEPDSPDVPEATPVPVPTATPEPTVVSAPEPTATAVATPAVNPGIQTQTISLREGWNLISLFVSPDDSNIRSVLESIDGQYSEVYTLTNGETVTFDPSRSDVLNALVTIEPGKGYWVKMSAAATLTVEGDSIDPTTPIALHAGWNLIAFPLESELSVSDALVSVAGSYDEVRGFETEALTFLPFIPVEFNTLMSMKPGKGYLIHMNSAALLQFPNPAGN